MSSTTLNAGQPHVNEEQNPQNNNPQHPLSNQMIEQINIALEQKEVQRFSQPGSLKPAVRDNVRKKAYTSIKSDEEWTSRVLPSNRTIL